jgi:hypothetical protein
LIVLNQEYFDRLLRRGKFGSYGGEMLTATQIEESQRLTDEMGEFNCRQDAPRPLYDSPCALCGKTLKQIKPDDPDNRGVCYECYQATHGIV